MNIDLKDSFEINENGTAYSLPCYVVEEGKGLVATDNSIDINFVRGSKLGSDNVDPKEGTLHEHLLSMMIHDLQFKQSLVPSRETAIVITHLQDAQNWLLRRQIDRSRRQVEGTYKK